MKKSPFLFLTSLALGACKKDDATPTTTDLLIAHDWVLAAQIKTEYVNGISTSNVVDEYQNSADCYRDNVLRFNSNHSIIVDEGALKCNTRLPQLQSGTWLLIPDNRLQFTDTSTGQLGLPLTVQSLTTTKMVLRYTSAQYLTNTVIFTQDFTYTAH